MKRLVYLLFVILGLSFTSVAQTSITGRIEEGLAAKKPAVCTSGDFYYTTDTFTLYQCGPLNTWTAVGTGSISPPGNVGDVMDKASSSALGASHINDGGTIANSILNSIDTYFESGRPWYSVRAYGAVCDSSTDNSTAFAAARNAAIANDGIAYIDACTGNNQYVVNLASLDNTGVAPNVKTLTWIEDAGLLINGGSLIHGDTSFICRIGAFQVPSYGGGYLIPTERAGPSCNWTPKSGLDVSSADIESTTGQAVSSYYFENINFWTVGVVGGTHAAFNITATGASSVNIIRFKNVSFNTSSCSTAPAYSDVTGINNVSFGRYFDGSTRFQGNCAAGQDGAVWTNVGDIRMNDGNNWWNSTPNHFTCSAVVSFCGGINIRHMQSENMPNGMDFNHFTGNFIRVTLENSNEADTGGTVYLVREDGGVIDGLAVTDTLPLSTIFDPASSGAVGGYECTGSTTGACGQSLLSTVVGGGISLDGSMGRSDNKYESFSCMNNSSTIPCHLVLQDTGHNSLDFYSRDGSTHYGGLQGVSGGLKNSGNLTTVGNQQSTQTIANQGTACTNGELALSGGWGSTAAVSAVAGTGQTCQWTITSAGSGTGANPTVTDTLTNALPGATTVCDMRMVGGTGTFTMINQTSLSATAPVFTFLGTPAGSSTTYIVVRRCGP